MSKLFPKTWWEKLCFIWREICASFCFALVLLMLSGCVNCYTRCPGTDGEIKEVYQSWKVAAGASYICAFPQAMSDCPSDYGFQPYNILTIPIGLVVFCDALCEGVIDTVCLPADMAFQHYRKGK